MPVLLAGILGLLCIAVTVNGTWIYDDILILRVDERLKNSIQFWKFWTESYHNGVDNLYRPLVSTTYALQFALHGDRAWCFHLVNILLHAAVSMGVARLAQKLAGNQVAWIAGAIFAAHPIHVEAVANIVGRAELLCALGAIGAMLLILRKPFTAGTATGTVLCFLVSLLSKEQGMLLPLLLGILWFAHRQRKYFATPGDKDIQHLKLAGASIGILLGAYVVLRENVLGLKFWWDRNFLDWTINPLVRADADRVWMPVVLLGRYIGLLFAPYKLSPDYGATVIGWQVDWRQPWIYLGFISIALWIALTIRALRNRDGAMTFCLLALAITYGIVGNIVSLIGTNFAERLMYLPSVFFVMVIAMLLAALNPRFVSIALTFVVLSFGIRTITYAAKWNDSTSFYHYAIGQQPKAIRLRMLLVSDHLIRGEQARTLGDERAAQSEFTRAKEAMDVALQILPEYDELWIQAASVSIAQTDFDAADQYLDQALQIAKADRRRSLIKASNWKTRVAELRTASTQMLEPP